MQATALGFRRGVDALAHQMSLECAGVRKFRPRKWSRKEWTFFSRKYSLGLELMIARDWFSRIDVQVRKILTDTGIHVLFHFIYRFKLTATEDTRRMLEVLVKLTRTHIDKPDAARRAPRMCRLHM